MADDRQVNWKEAWKVLYKKECKLISNDEAAFQLILTGMYEIEAYTLLWIVAVDGYIVKRYF